MWLLNFLPNIVVHLMVIVGIWGVVMSVLLGTLLLQYRIPVQVLSVVLLSLGIYLEGGISNEAVWRARVKELELKVAQAKAESAKVNTVVVTKYITKTQTIREQGQTITQYVDREIVKYDNTCKIPQEFIMVHNAAAKNDPSLLPKEQK